MRVGVMWSHSLAGGDALRGGGRSMLGCVLQSLDDLPLDCGPDGCVGGAPEVFSRPLQSVLTLAVIGARRAQLGRLHHLSGGVRELLCGRQQPLLLVFFVWKGGQWLVVAVKEWGAEAKEAQEKCDGEVGWA